MHNSMYKVHVVFHIQFQRYIVQNYSAVRSLQSKIAVHVYLTCIEQGRCTTAARTYVLYNVQNYSVLRSLRGKIAIYLA
jgi:hypothetical protein